MEYLSSSPQASVSKTRVKQTAQGNGTGTTKSFQNDAPLWDLVIQGMKMDSEGSISSKSVFQLCSCQEEVGGAVGGVHRSQLQIKCPPGFSGLPLLSPRPTSGRQASQWEDRGPSEYKCWGWRAGRVFSLAGQAQNFHMAG